MGFEGDRVGGRVHFARGPHQDVRPDGFLLGKSFFRDMNSLKFLIYLLYFM